MMPRARVRRMVVGVKEDEGMVEARSRLRVAEGKMVKAMMPGMFRRASAKRAVWIMGGIVEMIMEATECSQTDGLQLMM